MIKKTAIIGCGQAGGNNVATLLRSEELNKDSFVYTVINTTLNDVSELKDDDRCQLFIIGNTNGCGKDRKKSESILNAELKNKESKFLSTLVDRIYDCDVVIFTGAFGGGSGAGSMPILTYAVKREMVRRMKEEGTLENRNPVFLAIGILASLSDDDVISLANSIETTNDMFNKLKVPVILYDNDSPNLKSNLSLVEKHNVINEAIALDCKITRGDYCEVNSKYPQMDEKDHFKLYTTPGLMSISKISNLKNIDLDKENINELIVKSIKQNYTVQVDKDRVLGKIGLILNVTEDMLKKIDSSMTLVQEEFGKTAYIFRHINIVDSEKDMSIITILAGMSVPSSRLSELSDKIKEINNSKNSRKTDLAESLNETNELFNETYDEFEEDEENDWGLN